MPRPDAILEKRVVAEGLLEFSLLLKVAPDKWTPNREPTEGTTYADFDLGGIDKPQINDGYGSYVLTGASNVESQDDDDPQPWLGFWFAKSKTDAEKETPVRTYTECDGKEWPPILNKLWFIPDPNSPDTTPVATLQGEGLVSGVNYFKRDDFIPPASEGTLFEYRLFTSPTSFDIPQHEAPQGRSVSYDIPGGKHGSFPYCIGKEINIPAMASGTIQVVGEAATALGGGLAGQHFPATNFTEWAPYCQSDKQKYSNGVWFRIQIWAFPPAPPKPIRS